jgi:hypothetical protein
MKCQSNESRATINCKSIAEPRRISVKRLERLS